jgi:pyruvate ferredoxin oxidoreductase gamma subunit
VIRVRFHGRGGQGMKTASRILGTAALLDGRLAQDSPSTAPSAAARR